MFFLIYVLSSTKFESRRAEQFPPGGRGGVTQVGSGEVAQIMYTHISKCNNDSS
jgi:hypothetical protein